MHARWEREAEITKNNSIAKVCTISTTEKAVASSDIKTPTIYGKIIGVGKISTPDAKLFKLPENTETIIDKSAEFF